MYPTEPQGKWIPSRYLYESPIPAAQGRSRPMQFVGRRPRGRCNVRHHDRKGCRNDPNCIWVENKLGERYCRSLPGAVSSRFPSQVRYQPKYPAGATECAYLSRDECKDEKDCQWIRTRHGTEYCRGRSGQAFPFSSSVHPAAAEDDWLFTKSSNRFNPGRWNRLPENVKNQVFSEKGKETFRDRAKRICAVIENKSNRKECEKRIVDMFEKECRCLFEEPTSEVFRHGEIQGNPYAICNASISRSHEDIEELSAGAITARKLRSEVAKVARDRLCSKTLDVDHIPTPFLFGFDVNRLKTKNGQMAFGGKLPELEDFLRNRDSYRPLLVDLTKQYIASG